MTVAFFDKLLISVLFLVVSVLVFLALLQKQRAGFDLDITPAYFQSDEVAEADEILTWMRRAPLSATPLLAKSVAAQKAGDNEAALTLLGEALRRNPRSISANVWQIEVGLAQRDFEQIIDAIFVLVKIDPANQANYVSVLSSLLEYPENADVVFSILEARPEWLAIVMRDLQSRGVNNDILAGLAFSAPDKAKAAEIQRLVRTKHYADAFTLWLSFLPVDQLGALEWPLDPTFQGPMTYPPFDWRLGAKNVEAMADGGLYATYFGRNNIVFAQQILPLTEGRYGFSADMSGRAFENAGRIGWRVKCLGSGETVGSLAPEGLSDQPARFSFEFEIPREECAFQYLEMFGLPGQFAKPARAVTQRVYLEPIELPQRG